MKVQILSSNQIRALISSEELIQHGVDIENATYRDPQIRNLFSEVLNSIRDQVDEKTYKLPHRIEAIPISSGDLVLIITWAKEEREYLSEKGAVFTPPLPPAPGSPEVNGQPPYALPIDELQASVLADVVSAIATGDLMGHLKKYLNEDFLNDLIAALSASGLEDMISSFLSDSDTDGIDEMIEGLLNEPGSTKPPVKLSTDKKTKSTKTEAAVKYCICVSFKNLSSLENALSAAKMKSFAGESALFKTDKEYKLILSPGKLDLPAFNAQVSAFQAIYNGTQHPLHYASYLAEHNKTIIKKNAVKVLLGVS